jgi:hypothetical protein
MNKEIWISLVLTLILVLVFSIVPIEELPTWGGSGTERPGDSDMVLPGKGSIPAEVIMSESQCEPTVEVITSESQSEPDVEVIENCLDQTKDDRKEVSMNNMLVSFWCGVAAVLIGEASALMVAIALVKMKIRGMKNELSKVQQ